MHIATIPPEYRDEIQGDQIYKCPNCSFKNSGYIEKEASAFTLISSLITILMFRFYSLMILPLVIEVSKTCIKKCMKCDHVLDKKELLSLPSLTDKILSFKCGNCAIVISRKYALILTAILIVIYFFLPSTPSSTVVPKGLDLTTIKWENYVEDCGKQAILNNGVRAKKNFESKYYGNSIEWTGIVQSKIDKSRIRSPQVQEVYLVKMNPTDSKIEFPDLELIVPISTYDKYQEEFNSLSPMDIIKFKATFQRIGDEFQYHALEMLSVTNTHEKFDWSNLQQIDIVPQSKNLRKELGQQQVQQEKEALPSNAT